MKIEDALRGVSSVLLDTAPAIYYLELTNDMDLKKVTEVRVLLFSELEL